MFIGYLLHSQDSFESKSDHMKNRRNVRFVLSLGDIYMLKNSLEISIMHDVIDDQNEENACSRL